MPGARLPWTSCPIAAKIAQILQEMLSQTPPRNCSNNFKHIAHPSNKINNL